VHKTKAEAEAAETAEHHSWSVVRLLGNGPGAPVDQRDCRAARRSRWWPATLIIIYY